MAKTADTLSSYQKITSDIQSGRFSPLYLLHGDENYFIDAVTHHLENTVVSPESRSFNQSVVYGKDVSCNDVIAMARRYPMMSDFQLIVVKDAQDLKDVEPLISYLDKPLVSTVLVLAFRKGKIDQRSKLAKVAAKYCEVHFAKLRDYQIREWLPVFAKTKGKILDNDATNRLLDLLGADLPLIHNELEKIFATVKDEFVRINNIDEHVGFNREYNVFELQTALGARNFNKSIQIAHQMSLKMEKGELMRMMPVLFSYFSKIILLHSMELSNKQQIAANLGVNPYFLDDYMRAKANFSMLDLEWAVNQLKYLDLRLKGINRGSASDGDLLIETIVNILNRKK